MDFGNLATYVGVFVAGGAAALGGMKVVPPMLKKKATKKKRSVAAKNRYAKAKQVTETKVGDSA